MARIIPRIYGIYPEVMMLVSMGTRKISTVIPVAMRIWLPIIQVKRGMIIRKLQ
jgi:hypothetical protein